MFSSIRKLSCVLLLAAHSGCDRNAFAPPLVAARPAKTRAAETPLDERAPERIDKTDTSDAVVLADDEATLLLRERLSPPGQAGTPLAASEAPLPRPERQPDPLVTPLATVPLADVPKTPGVLPLERRKPTFVHPALDIPPLAAARDPQRPESPKLPVGPGAYVASPDARRMPHLAAFPRDPEPAVLAAEDPTSSATHLVVTAPLPLPAPAPFPPLRLAIPDPFEHARAVELRNPPPDAEPPVASHVRPPRPVLTLPP